MPDNGKDKLALCGMGSETSRIPLTWSAEVVLTSLRFHSRLL